MTATTTTTSVAGFSGAFWSQAQGVVPMGTDNKKSGNKRGREEEREEEEKEERQEKEEKVEKMEEDDNRRQSPKPG